MEHFSRFFVGLLLLATMLGQASAQTLDGEKLINARCAACHARLPEGGLNRISEIRKTPEGWDMTLVRMMLLHGLKITADERHTLVKYLADKQGLAPAETQDWRYILERRPNVIESPPDEELVVMCARCHSYARTALQRRDRADWLKHVHFHLGQYPTIEYQALGRDRNWWEIASTTVPKKLGELYPLQTDAWSQWQKQEKADLSGNWRMVGHRPGFGDYQGSISISGEGQDRYRFKVDLTYADGRKVASQGAAIVYTGYELRARFPVENRALLLVAALSEDGNTLSGRWFVEDADSIGGSMQARRIGADQAAILALAPAYLKSGQTANIAIHGLGLSGEVSLGEGVEVVKTVSQSSETIVVEAKAIETVAGTRTVKVGDSQAEGLFTVYPQIDSVRIEPGYAIARVGNKEGPVVPVPAQFDAVAYWNGADGKADTEDDVRIGVMPAQWSVDNLNEVAAQMQDTKFAGAMTAGGLFQPASAGPNPQRPYQTNNVGELAVKAIVSDGETPVEGSGHLVVTVQRWNDPPIR